VADPTNGILRVIEGTSEIARVPLGTNTNPTDVAIDPAGTRVYVATANTVTVVVPDPTGGQVAGTVVDPNGDLLTGGPSYLAIDSQGQFLYVANTGTLTVSAIDTTKGETGQVMSTISLPVSSGTIDPLLAADVPNVGPRIYVMAGTDKLRGLYELERDDMGMLSLQATTVFQKNEGPSGPCVLGGHRGGTDGTPFVYVACDASEVAIVDTVASEKRTATNQAGVSFVQLYQLQGTCMSGSTQAPCKGQQFLARGIDVTPNGQWLLIGVRSPDSLRIYDVGAPGTPQSGQPQNCVAAYDAPHDPAAVSVSADGTAAYIASRDTPNEVSMLVFGGDTPPPNDSCGAIPPTPLPKLDPIAPFANGGVEVWNHFTAPVVGPCMPPNCCTSASDCDDNNVCTTDTCNPATGCVHTNNTAPCDDGDACTTNDTCAGGSCRGGPPPNCDDNNVCTTDSCVANQCQHTMVPNCCTSASDCNDNNTCTTDSCVANQCEHAAVANCCTSASDCNDNNTCTTDSCVANQCQHAAVACIPTPPGTTVVVPGPAPAVTLNVERPPATTTTSAMVTLAGYASNPASLMADALGAADSAGLLLAVRPHCPCSVTAPPGTVQVTNCVTKAVKGRKSQVPVKLKLNKLGRQLLSEQGGFTLQVKGNVTEHHTGSSPLAALLKLLR
jgi:DNA-binding beta-propeller fold protein YncE